MASLKKLLLIIGFEPEMKQNCTFPVCFLPPPPLPFHVPKFLLRKKNCLSKVS